MFKKGFIFTGKWFTGKIEVLEVKEDSNELEVKLQHKVDATENESWWFETWDLGVVKRGWGEDYFLIGYNDEN